MRNPLKYSFLVLALALVLSSRAHADGDGGWGWNPPPGAPPPNNCVAPEVDPSLALSGFTLLAGTLTVLRSRRRKS